MGQIVLGGILVPIGLAIAGTSAATWMQVSAPGSENEHNYWVGASVALDVVGVAAIAIGAWQLSRGASTYADYKRERPARISVVPSLGIGLRGGFVGALLSY